MSPASARMGSADPEHAFGRWMRVPKEIGGGNTQSACVVVPEIDAHYARAKAEGAEIVLDLEDQEYGGRVYSCRDPEGYLWSFGSYEPWSE